MILVDTSVWADHFRRALPALEAALGASNVAIHPFVIGELACGTLADRTSTLRDFSKLTKVQRASGPTTSVLDGSRRSFQSEFLDDLSR